MWDQKQGDLSEGKLQKPNPQSPLKNQVKKVRVDQTLLQSEVTSRPNGSQEYSELQNERGQNRQREEGLYNFRREEFSSRTGMVQDTRFVTRVKHMQLEEMNQSPFQPRNIEPQMHQMDVEEPQRPYNRRNQSEQARDRGRNRRRSRGSSRGGVGRRRSNSNQSTHSQQTEQNMIKNYIKNCNHQFCNMLLHLIGKKQSQLIKSEQDPTLKNLKRQLIDQLLRTHENGKLRKKVSLEDLYFVFSSEICLYLTERNFNRSRQFIKTACRQYGLERVAEVCKNLRDEIKAYFVYRYSLGSDYLKEFVDKLFQGDRFMKSSYYEYFSAWYVLQKVGENSFKDYGDIRKDVKCIYWDYYCKENMLMMILEQEQGSGQSRIPSGEYPAHIQQLEEGTYSDYIEGLEEEVN